MNNFLIIIATLLLTCYSFGKTEDDAAHVKSPDKGEHEMTKYNDTVKVTINFPALNYRKIMKLNIWKLETDLNRVRISTYIGIQMCARPLVGTIPVHTDKNCVDISNFDDWVDRNNFVFREYETIGYDDFKYPLFPISKEESMKGKRNITFPTFTEYPYLKLTYIVYSSYAVRNRTPEETPRTVKRFINMSDWVNLNELNESSELTSFFRFPKDTHEKAQVSIKLDNSSECLK